MPFSSSDQRPVSLSRLIVGRLLPNLDAKSDLSCPAHAPSKRRRCRNPIGKERRAIINDALRRTSIHDPYLEETLFQVAKVALCHLHSNEVEALRVSRQWLRELDHEIERASRNNSQAVLEEAVWQSIDRAFRLRGLVPHPHTPTSTAHHYTAGSTPDSPSPSRFQLLEYDVPVTPNRRNSRDSSESLENTPSTNSIHDSVISTGRYTTQARCSRCRNVMQEPVETPCGHVFCEACINHWLSESASRDCPVCGRGIVMADIMGRQSRSASRLLAAVPSERASGGTSLTAQDRAGPRPPPLFPIDFSIDSGAASTVFSSSIHERSEHASPVTEGLNSFGLSDTGSDADVLESAEAEETPGAEQTLEADETFEAGETVEAEVSRSTQETQAPLGATSSAPVEEATEFVQLTRPDQAGEVRQMDETLPEVIDAPVAAISEVAEQQPPAQDSLEPTQAEEPQQSEHALTTALPALATPVPACVSVPASNEGGKVAEIAPEAPADVTSASSSSDREVVANDQTHRTHLRSLWARFASPSSMEIMAGVCVMLMAIHLARSRR